MRRSWAWVLGLAAAVWARAETVDLKGVVVDHDEVAIVGAKVKLKKLGLETSTGNNGSFHLTGTVGIGGSRGKAEPRMVRGQYRFEAGVEARRVSVSVFNLRGSRIAEKSFPVIGGAEYAFNPSSLLAGQPANGLYIVTLRAGSRTHAFKLAAAGIQDPGSSLLSRIAAGASGLAKRQAVLAVVDTLEITHEDHETLLHPIENYVADLDSLELEEERKLGRLLIADGASNLLKSLDLNTGAVLDSFDIGGPGAALYATANGRFGVAILGGVAGKVRIVNSGLYIEEHDDHIHREATAPRLMPFQWTGVKPVHYVSHHGWSAIHFDGDTAAAVDAKAGMLFLMESDFAGDSVASFGKELSGAAHGVGLLGEDGKLIVTVPNPHYANKVPGVGSTPYGLKIYDKDFVELQDFSDTTDFSKSCRGLHGEASMGRHVLFGCNGVTDSGAWLLTYDTATGRYASKKIRYLKDGRGTGTVKSHDRQDVFVGNLGPRHLARYRPSADALEAADVVELDSAQAGFEFEREHGEHLAVLTRSGKVHIFKPRNGWEKVKTVDLLTTDHWAAGKRVPKLITAPGFAYVSDPHNGKIHEVRLHDGEVTRVLTLGGQPWNMASQGWYDAFGREEGSH